MSDYEKAINFWDGFFRSVNPYKVENKFIDSELINNIFNEYLNDEAKVLDYGSGSGWGIFEMYLTKKFKEGVAIDTSQSAINLGNSCAELSDMNEIRFLCGNQKLLADYENYFDFVFSTNVLDVLPEEVMIDILDALYHTTKPGGHLLICLNPAFSEEELTNLLKMEKVGNYYYKDGILRSNHKSTDEWLELFKSRFTLVKNGPFKLMKNEKYSREMFLLKKEK